MSFGPTQIDQKSRKNVAWTMWNRIDPVSTMPAIQCHSTQANLMPTIGRKAVKTSTSIGRGHDPVEHPRHDDVPRDPRRQALAAAASMPIDFADSRLSWRENSM